MSTYRERRAARAERLREWAASNAAKASARFTDVERIADGIPFGQPILVGHHSEAHARRDADRIHAGMRAGVDAQRKGEEQARRAENIERAAERAIYSDDPDAAERLRARIAEREADRDAIKAYNLSCRRAVLATRHFGRLDSRTCGDLEILPRALRDDVARCAAAGQLREGWALPAYATSNLSHDIARLRARLAEIESRNAGDGTER